MTPTGVRSNPKMPIPSFDPYTGVLPPHLGDPTTPAQLSPHRCDIEEVCERFATSPERRAILTGLLDHRQGLLEVGIVGFQWLGGSFMEDVEWFESRPPNDVDAVTFVSSPDDITELVRLKDDHPNLFHQNNVKQTFRVDHYLVPLASTPNLVVDHARYWCGLFSHRRDDLWKGMLHVPLAAGDADDRARHRLNAASEASL